MTHSFLLRFSSCINGLCVAGKYPVPPRSQLSNSCRAESKYESARERERENAAVISSCAASNSESLVGTHTHTPCEERTIMDGSFLVDRNDLASLSGRYDSASRVALVLRRGARVRASQIFLVPHDGPVCCAHLEVAVVLLLPSAQEDREHAANSFQLTQHHSVICQRLCQPFLLQPLRLDLVLKVGEQLEPILNVCFPLQKCGRDRETERGRETERQRGSRDAASGKGRHRLDCVQCHSTI